MRRSDCRWVRKARPRLSKPNSDTSSGVAQLLLFRRSSGDRELLSLPAELWDRQVLSNASALSCSER